MYQADIFLAKRYIDGVSHFILSKDSDFPCYAGPNSIFICSVKVYSQSRKSRDSDLGNFNISGTNNSQISHLKNIIVNSSATWKPAECPIFTHPSYKIRALSAVAIGCDQFPSGISDVGPSTVYKELNNICESTPPDNNYESNILDRFMIFLLFQDKTKLINREVLLTFASDFLCEPGIQENHQHIQSSEYEYIFDQPTIFPSYLKDFCHPSSKKSSIIEGPEILTCDGYLDVIPPHKYLSAKGSFSCSHCAKTFCRCCGYFSEKKRNACVKIYKQNKPDSLCIDCYRSVSCSAFGNHPVEKITSIQEMREILLEKKKKLILTRHLTKLKKSTNTFSHVSREI